MTNARDLVADEVVVLGAMAVVKAKEPEDPGRNVALQHEVWRGQVRVFADDRLCAVVERPGDEPRAMLCTHTGQWVLAPEYAEPPIFLAWGRAMAIVAKAAIAFAGTMTEMDGRRPEASALVAAVNAVRATQPRRICDLQNEDYPDIRCRRRAGHKRAHGNKSHGCSWG